MSTFWKKATSPTSVEDAARLVLARHSITAELRRAVRELQLNFIGKDGPICYGEEVESLCHSLEAVFIHGLKYSFARKMSSIFNSNSDYMPEPDFWPVVMVYSHKQVLSQISNLSNVTTDVGRCRAWIRMALNDGLLKSYVDSLIIDKSTLNSYYINNSFLCDSEQPFIMRQFIEGLEVFKFKLSYNSVYLNSWSPEPLFLAGIWNPPESPEPVMPAEDVVESLNKNVKKSTSKTKRTKKLSVLQSSHISLGSQTAGDGATTTSSSLSETISIGDGFSVASSSSFPTEKSELSETVDVDEIETKSLSQNDTDDLGFGGSENIQIGLPSEQSPHSVPGFDHMFVDIENSLTHDDKNEESTSNEVNLKNSWSSFDGNDDQEHDFDSQSYDSIFQSYAKNKPAIHVLGATPELGGNFLKPGLLRSSKSETETLDSPEVSPDLSEFEVVPKTLAFASKHADESTRKFMSVFSKICPERGLDSQNYKCNNCNCHIGMIYGSANLCLYDGANYCSDCHGGGEYYIPSRILYNWDFRKHQVCKKAKDFLQLVQDEPLIDIRKQNPQLYSVVHELVVIQHLRSQLGFLRSYIFTCKEDIADEFRKILWPREYLYEHLHLYSLYDFLQIQTGALAQILQKAISFGKKHILKCHLCSQKGFICEICNSSKIIYPFETERTYHCEHCLGVYHLECMNNTKPCPKCQRKKKRIEESSLSFKPFN